jgi:hypothetical protein
VKLFLFLLIYFNLIFIPQHIQAAPFQTDFQNLTWDYHLIFKTLDIPPPISAPNSTIHSIYSPSVTKYNGKFYMLFGVAVNCNIYRDSIALATSSDGLDGTLTDTLSSQILLLAN